MSRLAGEIFYDLFRYSYNNTNKSVNSNLILERIKSELSDF